MRVPGEKAVLKERLDLSLDIKIRKSLNSLRISQPDLRKELLRR